MAHLSESIEVDAAPEAIYTLVSDLPRMGSWRARWEYVFEGTASGGQPARHAGHAGGLKAEAERQAQAASA